VFKKIKKVKMRILITGSSGLVGSALIAFLRDKEHEICCLIRDKSKVDQTHFYWDPQNGILDVASLENFNALIHLAGENISSRRWSDRQKQKISQSRLQSTQLLVDRIKETSNPPQVFISASAIGYYGDRGKEILTENSSQGKGFLADLVRDWENAVLTINNANIRTVQLRFGIILSSSGGALAKTLLPFRLGMGAILGDGSQYMSWITIKDVVNIIDFSIHNDSLSGPLNIVSPEPVTNYQYSKALGKALSRPVFFKAPSLILKLVLGEMADALLLSSSRVIPEKLLGYGYKFLNPTINDAFQTIFKESRA
jgi:uncharacterized protein (TIGR01777 family)